MATKPGKGSTHPELENAAESVHRQQVIRLNRGALRCLAPSRNRKDRRVLPRRELANSGSHVRAKLLQAYVLDFVPENGLGRLVLDEVVAELQAHFDRIVGVVVAENARATE